MKEKEIEELKKEKDIYKHFYAQIEQLLDDYDDFEKIVKFTKQEYSSTTKELENI